MAAKIVTLRESGEVSSLSRSRTPLGDVAELCMERRWKQREATTANRYIRTWNIHIEPYLGSVPVKQIRGPLIEDWLIQMETDGVKPDARRRALSLLRSILARAVEWEYLSTNPAQYVPLPPKPSKRAVRPLTPKSVEQIVNQLERPSDRVLVRVMAYAGVRPSEALALTSDHVRKTTLLVEQAVSDGKIKDTKTQRIRSVDLLPPLAQVLKDWVKQSGTKGLIFPNSRGAPWSEDDYRNWTRRIFNPARDAAGLEGTPYTLRHSFASLLIHAGYPVTYVASQLGHAPSMTLDTYAHVFADLERGKQIDPSAVVSKAMGSGKVRMT